MRSVLKVKPMEVMCSKIRGLITKMMMISMMMGCVSGTGTLHRVGGKLGWTPSVNFTEWSSHESFYVNDWLSILSLSLSSFLHNHRLLTINQVCALRTERKLENWISLTIIMIYDSFFFFLFLTLPANLSYF